MASMNLSRNDDCVPSTMANLNVSIGPLVVVDNVVTTSNTYAIVCDCQNNENVSSSIIEQRKECAIEVLKEEEHEGSLAQWDLLVVSARIVNEAQINSGKIYALNCEEFMVSIEENVTTKLNAMLTRVNTFMHTFYFLENLFFAIFFNAFPYLFFYYFIIWVVDEMVSWMIA